MHAGSRGPSAVKEEDENQQRFTDTDTGAQLNRVGPPAECRQTGCRRSGARAQLLFSGLEPNATAAGVARSSGVRTMLHTWRFTWSRVRAPVVFCCQTGSEL
ncbi:Hypothetical protein SMAX5B_001052 [Scophthalmus maximus]|uniref:Uncharacterized protein n=1 Tax=Scophthalmus maximus TaxID=52904 RepID=A0A2U9C247_SCOMX|nr:Hypothetical protein SMAX5B_001052 [Scophthalmus maximus]